MNFVVNVNLHFQTVASYFFGFQNVLRLRLVNAAFDFSKRNPQLLRNAAVFLSFLFVPEGRVLQLASKDLSSIIRLSFRRTQVSRENLEKEMDRLLSNLQTKKLLPSQFYFSLHLMELAMHMGLFVKANLFLQNIVRVADETKPEVSTSHRLRIDLMRLSYFYSTNGSFISDQKRNPTKPGPSFSRWSRLEYEMLENQNNHSLKSKGRLNPERVLIVGPSVLRDEDRAYILSNKNHAVEYAFRVGRNLSTPKILGGSKPYLVFVNKQWTDLAGFGESVKNFKSAYPESTFVSYGTHLPGVDISITSARKYFPSGGPLILVDACHHITDSDRIVELSGVDFYSQSEIYAPSVSESQKESRVSEQKASKRETGRLKFDLATHNILLNRRFVINLFNSGMIRAAPSTMRVLQMSDEEFAEAIDRVLEVGE